MLPACKVRLTDGIRKGDMGDGEHRGDRDGRSSLGLKTVLMHYGRTGHAI